MIKYYRSTTKGNNTRILYSIVENGFFIRAMNYDKKMNLIFDRKYDDKRYPFNDYENEWIDEEITKEEFFIHCI